MRTVTTLIVTLLLAGCIGESNAPAAEKPPLTTPPAASTPPTALEPTAPTPVEPPAPKFVLESVDVSPRELTLGKTVFVNATVVNEGTDAGTLHIHATWDGEGTGEVIEMDFVKGRRRTISFEVEASVAGDHRVGAAILGGELLDHGVRVLEPEARVTAWRLAKSGCDPYISMNLTVANVGGGRTEGYDLEVYSSNTTGKIRGSFKADVPDLDGGASVSVEGRIFAPFDCTKPSESYSLIFIMKRDGEERSREETKKFLMASLG